MHLPGRPVAGFDPEGLIFAAGINSEQVKLYDLRSFDKVSRCTLTPWSLLRPVSFLCGSQQREHNSLEKTTSR